VDLDGAPSFLVDKFLQPILKHHLSRRSRTRIEPPFEFLDANGMLDLGMLNLNRNGGLTAPDIFDPIVVAENFQCLRNRFIDAPALTSIECSTPVRSRQNTWQVFKSHAIDLGKYPVTV
jgi:hypothetical protein